MKSRIAMFGQVATVLLATLLATASVGTAHAAQVASAPAQAGTAAPQKTDRLVVQANQLVYNRDTNVVTAEGNVQLYYQGRTLEADKVIYNRATSRVYAEGNAKLTEADGSVTHATRFDLTDDFRSGFIDSLSTLTADKTTITAPRAERNEGETTVLDKSTYTACAPCKEHPERPPLWQVKAVKIIHKSDEQMIYYEDATFELAGVPLAYFPYLSSPDPSVTKKSGVLAPRFLYNERLGFGTSIPYFWNLAPDYDVTLTPTILTRQGVLGQAEFRQRLSTGTYNIRATGIYQLDPSAFAASPYGSGQRDLRGSIETKGQFYINPEWKYGWDIAVFSDKYFFQDYKVRDDTLTADYIRESISTVYLTGKGDRSFFDLRGYYIQGLSSFDFEKQQPLVLPTVDYNRTVAVDPARSLGIGGEVNIDANITALSRDAAYYESTGTRLLDKAYGLYDVCPTANPAKPNFTPPTCLLRGIGGSTERASAQITWQRKFIDPIGEVWTPFAFARFDVEGYNLNTSDTFSFTNGSSTSVIANTNQSNFFSSNNSLFARAMPGIGLDWRYPFVAQTGSVTHTLEPIAQVIVRPNETDAGQRPNEDAQSLFFDDTNLFEWNKFSGYDRVEGGVRANVGGQYSMTFQQGGYVNALFGESVQLAGTNSYGVSDISQVSSQSGLETTNSDYVGRFALAPNSNLSFIAKGRFNQQDFTPETIDLIGRFSIMDFSSSVQFSRYEAQPLVGYPFTREGVLLTGRYNFLDHYFVSANTTLDLKPYKYNTTTGAYDTPLGRPKLSVLGLGVGYNDECTTFSVNYSQSYTTASNTEYDDKTLTFTLTLRTLASASGSSALGNSVVEDGH
ncbi:LPS-assembly protein LptD [Lichenihabitans sp. Uapishka_5]|nr:LPS-assembly protein LptD [Lichenihabitans sp. Uapishka_5]MDX7950933.1 LPS-assembly protein LptD [Lichenihabitans sp. Uapishka_5]